MLDTIDKQILNIIQQNFPISTAPYRDIGLQLKLSEEEVITRIAKMKNEGVIRRIGATFEPRKIGYTSTLIATHIESGKFDTCIDILQKCTGVTHCYLRDNYYNLWFTLISQSRSDIEKFIENLKNKLGIDEIYNLPTKKRFKIKVVFKV